MPQAKYHVTDGNLHSPSFPPQILSPSFPSLIRALLGQEGLSCRERFSGLPVRLNVWRCWKEMDCRTDVQSVGSSFLWFLSAAGWPHPSKKVTACAGQTLKPSVLDRPWTTLPVSCPSLKAGMLLLTTCPRILHHWLPLFLKTHPYHRKQFLSSALLISSSYECVWICFLVKPL